MKQGSISRRARGLALWSRRPDWVEPMRASPSDPRALGGDWILEPRLEGARCLAWTSETGVVLRDGERHTINARHTGLVARLGHACRGEAILD